jgi:hypothetical protein
VRRRSPGNVIAELRELKDRYRMDGVMWLDDTFLLDRAWMKQLCDGMIAERLDLLWGANVRADVADRETLAMMKEAGLRVIHVGIESATQRILDEVYRKGITLEQVRETVHMGHDLGLRVRGYFMLGAPGETEAEARATLRLADDLPLDDVTFSITTPLPYTHLYEDTKHLVDKDFSLFDYYMTPVYQAARATGPTEKAGIPGVLPGEKAPVADGEVGSGTRRLAEDEAEVGEVLDCLTPGPSRFNDRRSPGELGTWCGRHVLGWRCVCLTPGPSPSGRGGNGDGACGLTRLPSCLRVSVCR